jgi:hypothetical protein
VKRRSGDLTGLLAWYPPTWRERYGDELVALIEDELDGRRPTVRFRASVAWSGLRERGHEAGLVGEQTAPAHQVRAGSLLVLCSWTAFVLAGASFSKLSEHFAGSMLPGTRTLAQGAFDAVVLLAFTGAVVVALGAVAALPSFVRFVRAGGVRAMRRPVATATLLTALVVALTIPFLLWAHDLNSLQRNGGHGAYAGAYVGLAVLVGAVLAQWTAVGVIAARRIDWSRRVLRVEAVLAMTLAASMVAISGATAIWWGSIGRDAPWFLQGTPTGTSGSPFTVNIVLTMALMVVAAFFGLYGVTRIARSWRAVSEA